MSRVRLWCDNARGKCWENTRKARKAKGAISIKKNNTLRKTLQFS